MNRPLALSYACRRLSRILDHVDGTLEPIERSSVSAVLQLLNTGAQGEAPGD